MLTLFPSLSSQARLSSARCLHHCTSPRPCRGCCITACRKLFLLFQRDSQHLLIRFSSSPSRMVLHRPARNNHLCRRALDGSTWPRSDPYSPGAGSAFYKQRPALPSFLPLTRMIQRFLVCSEGSSQVKDQALLSSRERVWWKTKATRRPTVRSHLCHPLEMECRWTTNLSYGAATRFYSKESTQFLHRWARHVPVTSWRFPGAYR